MLSVWSTPISKLKMMSSIKTLALGLLRTSLKTALVVLALAWYARRRFRQYVKDNYDPIPLPAMEDYSDKIQSSSLLYAVGAAALPPEEQLEIFKKMGMPKYFKSRLFFVPNVSCTVKEDRELASTKRKSPLYEVYRPFLGYHSILFQEGAKARKEREMLNKGFGQQTYRSLHSVMINASQRLLERMKEETNRQGFFDVEQLVSRATLEVIAEGGFSFRADQPENTGYLDALKRLMRIPGSPVCLLPYGTEFAKWWNRDALNKVQELLDRTVTERLNREADAENTESPTDLLDLVIASSKMGGDVPDVAWIRDQVNLLFIGGSDTSSVTLWWGFLVLGARPDIQEKIKQEITDVFSRVSDPYERVANLKYTEAFIKEILRMYPPFNGVSRRLDDDEHELRGVPIKKSNWLVVHYHAYFVQHRDEYFPNADEFSPERWLTGKADAEAFAAFSSGFRACLGKNFAMIEMKTILGHVLEKHRVVPVDTNTKFPSIGYVGQVASPIGRFDLKIVHDE